ncbi:MAG: NlpC/P60 family protein [[Clostridium] nexile]
MAAALPGDVVCWPGHVGIYIGGGQMIHAPDFGQTVKFRTYTDHLGLEILVGRVKKVMTSHSLFEYRIPLESYIQKALRAKMRSSRG